MVWIESFLDCLPNQLFSHWWGGERTDGFMHFSRALVWSETQAVFWNIWTRITESISYSDKRFAKHASECRQTFRHITFKGKQQNCMLDLEWCLTN